MREAFRSDMAELNRTLVSMAQTVGEAMRRATRALVRADKELASTVVTGDAHVDALYRDAEERVYELLARQHPVAGDLRVVVTGLHVAADLERMGDLAQHVAKIALLRHPKTAVPDDLADLIVAMGAVADTVAAKVTAVLSSRNATLAAELERDDDAMDELHRELFTILFGDWQHGIEAAVDGALLGRFYERYADHAVNAGRQVVFLVTGQPPTDSGDERPEA